MLIDPDTGDLQVKDGALALGDNTEQVAECVLLAARGELKEHPLVGAEITKLANGNGDPLWSNNAKQMLQTCGVPVSRVSIDDNRITLQTSGSVEGALGMSIKNDIPVSGELAPDVELETAPVVDKLVLGRYEARGVRPATDISAEDLACVPYGGIGFMGIEIDFIVS